MVVSAFSTAVFFSENTGVSSFSRRQSSLNQARNTEIWKTISPLRECAQSHAVLSLIGSLVALPCKALHLLGTGLHLFFQLRQLLCVLVYRGIDFRILRAE